MTDLSPERLEKLLESDKAQWLGVCALRDLAPNLARQRIADAETIARLRWALEPFVRHGRAIGALGDEGGPFWVMTDAGHRDVPVEDFRRARAALALAGIAGKRLTYKSAN